MPGLRIIAGGCEVQPEALHVLAHPAVDVAVIGEGELAFCDLLEHYLGGSTSPPAVQSIVVAQDGNLHHYPRTAVLGNLDTLPSPLLLDFVSLAEYPAVSIETMR
ncbi:MAG: hypothetical protein AB1486_30145 [Planctomycetota bacterium]